MAEYKDGQTFGRPRKEFDQKIFEGLCKIQCTMKEIAGFFETTEDTLITWTKRTYGDTFSSVYKGLQEGGKCSLRRLMWKHCERSVPMCIFMAKNMLGMKDIVIDKEDGENMAKEMASALINLASKKGNEGVVAIDTTNGETTNSN